MTTVVSTSCLSAGEALRLIDQKDVIKSDFVLVSGDTVSNMNLAPVLEAHRARRQKDKSNIFTMVGGPGVQAGAALLAMMRAQRAAAAAVTLLSAA